MTFNMLILPAGQSLFKKLMQRLLVFMAMRVTFILFHAGCLLEQNLHNWWHYKTKWLAISSKDVRLHHNLCKMMTMWDWCSCVTLRYNVTIYLSSSLSYTQNLYQIQSSGGMVFHDTNYWYYSYWFPHPHTHTHTFRIFIYTVQSFMEICQSGDLSSAATVV